MIRYLVWSLPLPRSLFLFQTVCFSRHETDSETHRERQFNIVSFSKMSTMCTISYFGFKKIFWWHIFFMYLQVLSSVVIVFDSVIHSSPSRNVQHSNPQMVQRFVGQSQVSDNMPNTFITTCKELRGIWSGSKLVMVLLICSWSYFILLILHRLTAAGSGRHSPVCISQWPLSQSHSVEQHKHAFHIILYSFIAFGSKTRNISAAVRDRSSGAGDL